NSMIFVSAGNTVDRLLSLQTDEGLMVSNSLACLLAVSNASIDITYPDYYQDFTTIIHGLTGYKRAIATSLGDIQITMFGYIVWNGSRATYNTKNIIRRDFGNFMKYEHFLQENLNRIAQNMNDSGRKKRYQFLATASSGY